MSAHPEGEAVEAGPADPLDEISKFIGEEDEQDDSPPPEEDDPEEPEGDEPEDDLDEETDEDEPAEPAIAPPVSLNKEQKAAFAQLPPDLQKVWAESEAQRNRDVQIKTTEAAEAKRNAQSEAQAALSQIQWQYASELEVYAQAFKPTEPDPALLAHDPVAYAQEVAYARQQQAEYDRLMQQVQAVRGQASEASQQMQQQQLQAEMQKLAQAWPEWNDPAKRTELAQSLTATASELGYTQERIALADAQDLIVLRQVSEWKAGYERDRAFQARKMERVRAARGLPKVSTPGNVPSRNPSKAQRADAAWQRAKTSKSGDDYAAFLEAQGINLG